MDVSHALRSAVIDTLDRFADGTGLPLLAWTIVRYPEGLVFEGRPKTVAEASRCEDWALLLGMQPYGFENALGERTWYLNDDVWSIEIVDVPHNLPTNDG
jgi:hypothetical protein